MRRVRVVATPDVRQWDGFHGSHALERPDRGDVRGVAAGGPLAVEERADRRDARRRRRSDCHDDGRRSVVVRGDDDVQGRRLHYIAGSADAGQRVRLLEAPAGQDLWLWLAPRPRGSKIRPARLLRRARLETVRRTAPVGPRAVDGAMEVTVGLAADITMPAFIVPLELRRVRRVVPARGPPRVRDARLPVGANARDASARVAWRRDSRAVGRARPHVGLLLLRDDARIAAGAAPGDERGAAEARRGPPAWAAVLDAQWPGSAGRAAAWTLPGALRAAADVAVVGLATMGLQGERRVARRCIASRRGGQEYGP